MKENRDGVTVTATPLEAWEAWTTRQGLESFLAPKARVRLRVGGAFEVRGFDVGTVALARHVAHGGLVE